ncbi:putative RNase H-like HicB family nuclease [Rhodothalassium salexigens DSM 2132]|uniref:Putative RNase H-like HicB family nuclease n=1 Tax=Rhodothalassium salexigens DSM 2132 TaxID=1188247 RepID=A0A4R2P4L6_RHOSA|nr:type II toxin-antitoxin system HicB family antitoxin [Rhodothalassium salexigens]MBB4212804.1 putative RNase H-like HicB family nuclease [Rhodothalassium salexigens DSM 2132]MBK1638945.1 hypothetical protein [Rhodothalassium salexigens DSM 2132]TCP29693.1 putative RNase H-like HicB family nuclease [Rhodothalassium salexigens DSM 2132]
MVHPSTPPTYMLVVEGTPATGYSGFFPAVPGCATAGDTWDEIATRAPEGLSLHLDGLRADGEPVPEPRPIKPEDLAGAEDFAGVLAVSYIPETKARRIGVIMDEGLIARIDRVAKNRSAFLAQAAERALERQETM